MDKQRWAAINEIFHATLEAPAEDRGVVLATLTRSDPTLRPEVEQLLKADCEADSYLDSIEIPLHILDTAEAALSPDDLLGNRFRIVEEIAEGGMGRVFRAFDNELGIEIALKVIRPEIAANPEAIARFRQEVLLARSISNPHICRTFDIDRAPLHNGEIVFLTMEFLHGETIAARLKRTGPLPLELAAGFARQIGEALAAAHKLNIVHRDMKPSNIMIVPAGEDEPPRIVVMDFGLARLAPVAMPEGKTILTGTNRPIGTLGYMAPEQLEGARVSPATDIYALGLILFEMATAERIFPERDLLSDIAQRIKGPAPSPRDHHARLPEPWCRAIEACLQTDPADRPQQVAQVIALLEDQPSGFRPRQPATPRPRWLRFAAVATICLLAVSLFAAGLRLYKTRANTSVAPGALVYLPQVENQTGEHALDSLTELLRAGLTQSAQINLLDQGKAGDTMQQMKKNPGATPDQPTAREVAMRAGAARVVFATIQGGKGSYRLDIDIQQPDNKPTRYREHWTKSFAWHSAAGSDTTIPAEMLTAIRNASDWIRHEAGESANDIARLDAPPEDVTTANWEALQQFGYARRLLVEHKREDAVNALQNAIKADPGFAMAYADLGDLLVNMTRQAEGYTYYLKALDVSAGNRLSLRERKRIAGISAQDTGDYQASEDAFREYCAYYEHDYVAWFYRALPLVLLGRPHDAMDVLQHAHAVNPKVTGAVHKMAILALTEGDLPTAHHWIDELNAMKDRDDVLDAQGTEHILAGEYDAARASFEMELRSDRSTIHLRAMLALSSLAGERGDSDQAIAVLRQALSEYPSNTALPRDLAQLYCQTANFTQCFQSLDRLLQLDPNPDSWIAAGQILGSAFEVADEHWKPLIEEKLVALRQRMPVTHFGLISQVAEARLQGEVLLAQGRTGPALEAFEKADALEPPVKDKDYLARALEAEARHEHDPARAGELRKRALTAYGVIALHPGVVWGTPWRYLPGTYSRQLTSWLRLAASLPTQPTELNVANEHMTRLRPHPATPARSSSHGPRS